MRARRPVLIGLVGGALVLLLLRLFVLEIARVSSPSMAPTLLVGDRLLVDKLHPGALVRGDIVVFTAANGEKMVKRVVGLPGDEVEDTGRSLKVNGELLRTEAVRSARFNELGEAVDSPIRLDEHEIQLEHFQDRRWEISRLRGFNANPGSWRVPPDNYFVLGDNRDASLDSRDPSVGPVPRSAVVGRVTRVLCSHGATGWRSRTWVQVP